MRRIIRAYLSLTRTERNGFMVLSLLMMVLLAGRALLPVITCRPAPVPGDGDSAFWAFQDVLPSTESTGRYGNASLDKGEDPGYRSGTSIRYFEFDPNLISYGELLTLGLSPAVARTLINYRESGGRFHSKADLLKVYGLEAADHKRLEPYIKIPPAPEPAGKQREPMLLELNGTDSLQLQGIYRIGPVFARRIIRYRDLLGGYYALEQLKEVYGLGDPQYREIIRHVFIDTSRLRKMDLNRVESRDLSGHPYLTPYQADALLAYRTYTGQWKDISEILQHQLIPDSVFQRIRPYLMIGR